MPSKIPPGSTVIGRMKIYRRLVAIPTLRQSYARKFAAAAFVSAQTPLAVFIVYLMVARADWAEMFPLVAALLLASVAGFLGTIWLLREILVPIELTAEALRAYLESRALPDLPVDFPDQAGRLMEGTQYTLTQLNETINRLEHVSDSDELTGIYNRRAGEKRLTEEIARAERDLETFHVAFFALNGFKAVIEAHGHSAGDACFSHVAALLQLNIRRGDWVARWGADELVVGLHRNRSLKQVMERVVAAIAASPCEIAPGQELQLTVSAGVAEYRFGAGKSGLLADTDRALFEARHLAKEKGGSQVCYFHEVATGTPMREVAVA
ncbi:MAG TPA: GGDEF domain-containing protein [Usitatibacteraceae bacterium]|nr:GGDEF domain-containing protein [Usitatibacteraceae bacterium]